MASRNFSNSGNRGKRWACFAHQFAPETAPATRRGYRPLRGPLVTWLMWSSRSLRIHASPIGPSPGSGTLSRLAKRRPPQSRYSINRCESQGVQGYLTHGGSALIFSISTSISLAASERLRRALESRAFTGDDSLAVKTLRCSVIFRRRLTAAAAFAGEAGSPGRRSSHRRPWPQASKTTLPRTSNHDARVSSKERWP